MEALFYPADRLAYLHGDLLGTITGDGTNEFSQSDRFKRFDACDSRACFVALFELREDAHGRAGAAELSSSRDAMAG